MHHHMSNGRVPNKGHELERPAGPLRLMTSAVHNSGPGGRGPPPSVLPNMQFVCSLKSTEQEASGHSNVRQGGGAET